MAPEKSNADNACCFNLCNTFVELAVGVLCMFAPHPIFSIMNINELCGCYDCVWLYLRGCALEPPFVTSWNRLVNSKPGGKAVYG